MKKHKTPCTINSFYLGQKLSKKDIYFSPFGSISKKITKKTPIHDNHISVFPIMLAPARFHCSALRPLKSMVLPTAYQHREFGALSVFIIKKVCKI